MFFFHPVSLAECLNAVKQAPVAGSEERLTGRAGGKARDRALTASSPDKLSHSAIQGQENNRSRLQAREPGR